MLKISTFMGWKANMKPSSISIGWWSISLALDYLQLQDTNYKSISVIKLNKRGKVIGEIQKPVGPKTVCGAYIRKKDENDGACKSFYKYQRYSQHNNTVNWRHQKGPVHAFFKES